MSIRPVDMQVMLPKLSNINQAKPKVVNQSQNQQHQAQNINQQETEKKLRKVTTFEKKEHPKVTNEEKKQAQEKNKDKSKKKKNNETNENEDKEVKKEKVRHLDIRI